MAKIVYVCAKLEPRRDQGFWLIGVWGRVIRRWAQHLVTCQQSKRVEGGEETDLFGALLLFDDFLFLGDYFGLVLEAEGEREGDEEGGGSNDPNDAAYEFSAAPKPRRRFCDGRDNGVTCGWGDDVLEGGEAVEEGLIVVVERV